MWSTYTYRFSERKSEHGSRVDRDSLLQPTELALTRTLAAWFSGVPLQIKQPFCAENEFVQKLRTLADDVALIEALRGAARDSEFVSPDSDSRLVLSPLLSKLHKAFSDNNGPEKLRQLARALEDYNDGFRDRSNEEQAALHALVAGHMLSGASAFSLPKIKAFAQMLWAGARCRAKGKSADLSYDDPNLQAELAALPEIKWARVWEKMGINRKRSKARGKSSGQKRRSTRKK